MVRPKIINQRIQTSISIERDDYEKVRKLAERSDTTVSGYFRWVITEHLNTIDDECPINGDKEDVA